MHDPSAEVMTKAIAERRETPMKYPALVGGMLVVLSAIASGQASAQTAKAELRDAQGETIGLATLTQEADGVRVAVEVSKLPPGLHGFHVHAVGKCDPPGFTSAGGHLNPALKNHPDHAGDMPALLVNANGSASMTFRTDRFRVSDLFVGEGRSLIIHAKPDNYANIPTDRYRPDPDATTLATGDAGGRLACGVVTQ